MEIAVRRGESKGGKRAHDERNEATRLHGRRRGLRNECAGLGPNVCPTANTTSALHGVRATRLQIPRQASAAQLAETLAYKVHVLSHRAIPQDTGAHHQTPPSVMPAGPFVEAWWPWPQSWKRRSYGSSTDPVRAAGERTCDDGFCKKRRAWDQTPEVCKGQVSALPALSDRSVKSPLLFTHNPPNITQSRAIRISPCLRRQTPRLMTGSWPSPLSPSFLRRPVTVPTMSPTLTPLQWLQGPFQCRKLVCLRSSQSSWELSRLERE